jgi:hypothetical protein
MIYLLFGWQGIRHRFPRYSTLWATPGLWVLNLLRRGASPPQIGLMSSDNRGRILQDAGRVDSCAAGSSRLTASVAGAPLMKGRLGGFKAGSSD